MWAISRSPCELDGDGCVLRSFILKFAQQEEALHHIWYTLKSDAQKSWAFGRSSCSVHSLKGSPLDKNDIGNP
ncbi:unnamed protein product [Spirodela intermedia]|uniref:Uncharacterized protein n=1 Tax=Spirodela intermedia TaxID=51605 RepID=A0ABN7ED80_SPIIN|nr:unnamed protein product [Spirodela intermedia]